MNESELIRDARGSATVWNSQGGNSLGELLVDLAARLELLGDALDRIAERVTPDDYDNPSSALESIARSVMGTGRKIEGY